MTESAPQLPGRGPGIIPRQSADGRQDAVRRALLGAGMSDGDARRWASTDLGLTSTQDQITLALDWHSQGVDAHWATEWCAIAGLDPGEVIGYYRRGYSPRQADFASTLILKAQVDARHEGRQSSTEEEWLDAELTPTWVCLSLAAGCVDVREAIALYKTSLTDGSIAGTLALRGDLRGADTRNLELHPSYLLR